MIELCQHACTIYPASVPVTDLLSIRSYCQGLESYSYCYIDSACVEHSCQQLLRNFHFIWCFVQPHSQPLQPQHWWKKSVSYISFKVQHHHTFLHNVLYRYIQFLVHLCGSTQLHFFLQCTWSVCVNLSSTNSVHTCVSHWVSLL